MTLGLVLCAGCGATTPEAEAAATEPPAEPIEATPEPEAQEERLTTPRALLVALRDAVRAGDDEAVRALVLDYRGPGGRFVPDLVLTGIREGDDRGDWAFSLPALEVAIERADEIVAPEGDTAQILASMFGPHDPRLRDPTRLRVFEGERSRALIVLVETDGEMRLAFWENLTGLRPRPAHTTP